MMLISPIWAAWFTCSGLILYYYLDVASGATIILIAGFFYFLSMALRNQIKA
jgi:ABC-type Mn2+/Zn2+ transport system permease subunit